MTSVEPNYDRIYLIGVRFDPDRDVDWFTLLLEGEPKYDLILSDSDRYLVFFRNAHQAQHYLETMGGEAFRKFSPAPTEMHLLCDIALTLRLLTSKKQDDDACIVNTLNTLFDLVASTKSQMPQEYRAHLKKLADHFTFHRNIELDPEEIRTAVNGVLWCVGAIVSKSHFYPE